MLSMSKFIFISLISINFIAGCSKTDDDKPVTQISAPQVSETYDVVVVYNKSIKQMVAEGKYYWSATSENFLVDGSGTVEIKLRFVHFGRDTITREVAEYLESNGLRAARVEELLAFGAKYPEKQEEFPIVAFGSAWVDSNGNRGVPYLGEVGSKRVLLLGWDNPSNEWYDSCRFLAANK